MRHMVQVSVTLIGLAFLTVNSPAQMFDLRAESSLVADVSAVSPGASFSVGLRLRMPRDAYVYWRNPGDAGLPTTVRWSLPEGFEAGELEWPTPARLDEQSLRSFGYKEEVVLPVRIQVSEDWRPEPGGRVMLRARADWLVCRDACVPGGADLELALTAAEQTEPDPVGAPLIERYRSRMPGPAGGWSGGFRVGAQTVHIELVSPGEPEGGAEQPFFFLPYIENVIEPAADPVFRRTERGWVAEVTRDVMRGSPGDRLPGVLLLRTPGAEERAIVVVLRAL